MIRLANIMAGAPQGGAEAFYERLTLALHGAGEEVLPVIRRDAARAARIAAASPVQLRFGGALDILTPLRLGRMLSDWRPRVAMAWMNRAAGMTPRGDWTLVGRLGGYYHLKYYRHCDHLVGNTRDLQRWIIAQGWPDHRVHYLPNFATDFRGQPAASRSGAGHLLAMGRLHANKGFDTLIRALSLVPEARLSIAGEGPERPALEALARECGVADRLTLLGWRQDTGALLAECDLFLCPSRHEPLGNVVLEAWSAARPVIAAAAQGPSELIADGETGLLVPVDQPEPMAAAIRAMLADPARAQALAAAGRARFERDFAEAPVLAQWREFLHKVQR
jgi:glycosyltransferase involved in cell wall biosynthesis